MAVVESSFKNILRILTSVVLKLCLNIIVDIGGTFVNFHSQNAL